MPACDPTPGSNYKLNLKTYEQTHATTKNTQKNMHKHKNIHTYTNHALTKQNVDNTFPVKFAFIDYCYPL